MMRLTSRRILIAATVVVALGLLAGGATALAESGSGSSGSPQPASKSGVALFAKAVAGPVGSKDDCGPLPPKPLPDFMESAAAYLGLSEEQLAHELEGGKSLAEVASVQGKSVDGLKQALLDAAKTGLDKAVADGDLTAEEAQAILTKLEAGVDDLVNGKGGLTVRVEVKGGGPDIAVGEPFKTAADYLGLSVEELKQELHAGKSLAEIASGHGKSVSGLKQALIQAATADLEKAVDKLVNQKGLPEPCVEKVGAIAGPGVPDVRVGDTP
jgi:hypothetical protein